MIYKHSHTGDCEHACCLRVEDLCVQAGGSPILSHIDLHMHCGQIVALIGPNGAGKSTLIQSILGQREYSGKITFHDASGRQTKLRIGYVPQSPRFAPGDPISVLDLFACCMSRRPAFLRPTRALRETVLRCLSNVHAEALIDKRVGTLSGGDVEGMTLLMDMLDEIRQKFDLSILMTTHDFSMLERYCDRVVLLRGHILRQGTPLDVLSSDEFAEAFHMTGGGAV